MPAKFSQPEPFKVQVPEEEIQRLRTLLKAQRLPENPILPDATFQTGTELSWMQKAKRHLIDFDWRAAERTLNSFDQFLVEIEGATIHFVHQKSTHKNAIPLLLLHGWGSTVSEFNKVISPLVNPPEGKQAFHVVAPSLPGIGYSPVLPKAGANVEDNARIFNTLMTEVLGYETYVGQGGDFGAINLRQVQFNHSNNMKLALYNCFFAPRPANADDTELPEYEKDLLGLVAQFTSVGMGYFALQSTKVSTIGLALYDNPQGFLSYLGEKYVMIQNWSNMTEEDNAKFMDELMIVICYSQFTNSIHTGMAMYQHSGSNYGLQSWAENPESQCPFGVHHFKGEFYHSPESWIKEQGPLIWHKYHPRGGHFAAIGAADDFVEDCREFYGKYYWEQPGVAPRSS
ncbi:epoxide hydrolase [Ceratobasidium sp. AG-Ba]|nr:epoxide hydrolase [Ceratobasidium sp. AG-Ba]QRW10070.1 epoxide hydrolase [Ceratobasidium sp. AG-Ba]